MIILRIEHPVPSFDAWKRAFDGDPVGREASGVRRYRVLRPVDDPAYVAVDLELDGRAEAEALLAKLRELWTRVEGKVMSRAQARIFEVTESKEVGGQPRP